MDYERTQILFNENKSLYGMNFEAKEEQIQITMSVMNGRSVLGFLPTGFGKTVCIVMPSVVRNSRESITIVVSPLLSLMEDQMSSLRKWSFTCYKAGADTEADSGTMNGIVFFSPELLQTPFWRRTFLSAAWQKKVSLIAIDEAHCISEWGEDFRQDYQQLGMLRSIYKVPVMALTATGSEKVKADIMLHLQLHDVDTDIVAKSADRPNICIQVLKKESVSCEVNLDWLISHVRARGKTAKKVIIYCRGIDRVAEIFMTFKDTLGCDAYVGKLERADHLLVEMFHRDTDQHSKDRILDDIKNTDGSIRVIVATVALGMGLDIRDVDLVIHYGCPKSVLSYWQEAGRCARDGRQGFSLILYDSLTLRMKTTKPEIRDIVKNDSKQCYREQLLTHLTIGTTTTSVPKDTCTGCELLICQCDACKCCSACMWKCICSSQFDIRQFMQSQ